MRLQEAFPNGFDPFQMFGLHQYGSQASHGFRRGEIGKSPITPKTDWELGYSEM